MSDYPSDEEVREWMRDEAIIDDAYAVRRLAMRAIAWARANPAPQEPTLARCVEFVAEYGGPDLSDEERYILAQCAEMMEDALAPGADGVTVKVAPLHPTSADKPPCGLRKSQTWAWGNRHNVTIGTNPSPTPEPP